MRRAALIALVVVAVVALAVQLVSSALYGVLAATPSVPRALSGDWPYALTAQLGLDRFPAVRVALVRAAIVRGEPRRAADLLATLGEDRTTIDLRGRLALLTGDPEAALRDFAAVDDYSAARSTLDALARRDPVAALRIVRGFDRRLAGGAAPPEITADVEWREGQIAAAAAYADPSNAAAYNRAALDAYGRALARAPNEETYLLAYAYQVLAAGDAATSRETYRRAVQSVPDSVDAYVGLAVASAALGDCAAARTALGAARAHAADQHRTLNPGAGYSAAVRAALSRCGV